MNKKITIFIFLIAISTSIVSIGLTVDDYFIRNSDLTENNNNNNLEVGTELNPIIEFNNKIEENNYIIHDSIWIDSDLDLENYANGGGIGTKEEPFILENYNITAIHQAIYITDTSKYFIIRNCLLNGSSYTIDIQDVKERTAKIYNNTIIGGINCIRISNTNNTIIVNNTCITTEIGGGKIGIELEYSSYTTIVNNSCSNTDRAILIEESNFVVVSRNKCYLNNYGLQFISSEHASITNNEIYNNLKDGMSLVEVTNFTISENSFHNNTNYNMIIQYSNELLINNNNCSGSSTSIYLQQTNKTTIIENNIINNNVGIALASYTFPDESDRCYEIIIKNNYISNNSGASINLPTFSKNCEVYNNHFINNGPAYDRGIHNKWYNTLTNKGNYWDDYNFSGTYLISGDANNFDPYPISEEPQVNTPEDFTYNGTAGEVISWLAIDDNPSYYSIYIDNSEIISNEIWSTNEHINISIESTSKGNYNYTIILIDEDGHHIKDTVIITIVKNPEASGLLFIPTILGVIILREIKRRKEE